MFNIGYYKAEPTTYVVRYHTIANIAIAIAIAIATVQGKLVSH